MRKHPRAQKSPDKYKTVLRPIEFTALMACEDVPRAWRETYAVALFTYARPGELRVLTWDKVDFTTNQLRIDCAWDYEDQTEKPTKTWETRDVPIEPTLLPCSSRCMSARAGRGSCSRCSRATRTSSASRRCFAVTSNRGRHAPRSLRREHDADPDPFPVAPGHRDHLAPLARRQPVRGPAPCRSQAVLDDREVHRRRRKAERGLRRAIPCPAVRPHGRVTGRGRAPG